MARFPLEAEELESFQLTGLANGRGEDGERQGGSRGRL